MNLIYLQLFENKIVLESTKNRQIKEFSSPQPFSDSKMIVSNYEIASKFILKCITENRYMGHFIKPLFLVHVREISTQKLSKSESDIILQTAYLSGARKVYIYQGDALNFDNIDDDFLKKLEAK